MPPLTSLSTVLSTGALAILVSSCAARQEPQEIRVVVVHEPAAAAPAAPDPDQAADPDPAPAAAPAPAPAPAAVAGCVKIRAYSTGWIEAQCQGMQLRIQAGYAAKNNPITLASLALDEIGRKTLVTSSHGFSERARLIIAGKSVVARDFVIREAKQQRGLFGGGTFPARDPQGTPRYRSLFAHFAAAKSGKIGASCTASASTFDRERCKKIFNEIATHGLPGGDATRASVSAPVAVAGVQLRLGRGCWSSGPQSVYCIGKGGMNWSKGSEAEMNALVDERVRMLGGGVAALPDGRVLKKTSTSKPCKIGKTQSTCTSSAFYGVVDTPSKFQYLAMVPTGPNQATVIECRRTPSLEPAPACQQIFQLP